jgi:hypothetical protein
MEVCPVRREVKTPQQMDLSGKFVAFTRYTTDERADYSETDNKEGS